MRRITQTEVILAYARLNANTVRNTFGTPYACCGLSALMQVSDDPHIPDILHTLQLSIDYVRGFLRGFDGKDFAEPLGDTNKEEYKAGFEDGKAIGDRLFN